MRSEAPAHLGPAGRAALTSLGVRTALDLRELVERELHPALLDGLAIDRRDVPVIGDGLDATTDMELEDIYRELLERRGERLTAAVRVLSEPDALPALVYCAAGKDRTGLVIALTLAAVGASDQAIVKDYALSEQVMRGPFWSVIVARAEAAGIPEQQLAAKMGSPPQLMRDVLRWLRERDGGAVGYLRRHGFGDQERLALRRALVEPTAAASARPRGWHSAA